ncbi:hypothetical protein [Lachnoanaerobaculum sp. Marseille-Q4761]
MKKYRSGREYTKCLVYGEKREMVMDFKKGDLKYDTIFLLD